MTLRTVQTTSYVLADGKSNWLEGVILVGRSLILSLPPFAAADERRPSALSRYRSRFLVLPRWVCWLSTSSSRLPCITRKRLHSFRFPGRLPSRRIDAYHHRDHYTSDCHTISFVYLLSIFQFIACNSGCRLSLVGRAQTLLEGPFPSQSRSLGPPLLQKFCRKSNVPNSLSSPPDPLVITHTPTALALDPVVHPRSLLSYCGHIDASTPAISPPTKSILLWSLTHPGFLLVFKGNTTVQCSSCHYTLCRPCEGRVFPVSCCSSRGGSREP